MYRSATFCATTVLLTFASHVLHGAEPEALTLNVGGLKRQALVYAPAPPTPSNGSPLVFVFHGHGGSMQNIARTMNIQSIWPEAIVVYPQGVPTPTKVDPAGKKDGWQRGASEQGGRDLRFFDAMLDTVAKKYAVDRQRIYVTGFSNGGVFAYVLWEARPKVFAAVAPCAGLPLPGTHMKVPKPAFIVAGEADAIVPIANQRAMIEDVRKLDGANASGESVGGVLVFHSSKGSPVQTYVHRGGHILPAEVPKMIVDFFRAYELKK
jgi:polyhydroxybutyrate depolymerase